MTSEALTAITTLLGVVLGGGLSYLVQHLTQRSAQQLESRRHLATITEARRTERIAVMDRFMGSAQAAERAAIDRHHHSVDGAEWLARATVAMDDLWVAEKMVRILCSPTMHSSAHEFANALVVAIDYPVGDFDARDHLAAAREKLLATARSELGLLRRTLVDILNDERVPELSP